MSFLFSLVLVAAINAAVPGLDLGDQMHSIAAPSAERILPQDVSTRNLEAYEAQFRRDIPVGTPKAEVEGYLTRMNIRHLFLPSSIYGNDGNVFQAVFNDIGTVLGFQASLGIWIRLDEEDKVREIVFRLQYL
jgi:hypothetical protein